MNYYKKSPVRELSKVQLQRKSPFDPVNRIQPELSWWIKITTAKPYCIYYFGPFNRQGEAAIAQYGYIEDLREEGASGIKIEIRQDRPKLLTICEEDYSNGVDY